jgi:hypothetical protein
MSCSWHSAVVATCDLVRSSFTASRCTGIVLTRGALQPLRETLTLLGEDDSEFSPLSSFAVHPPDLPIGSTAGASFEATGES